MKKRIPVACTLGPTDAVDQLGEWQALQRRRLGIDRLEGGMRLRLPPDLRGVAEDLARRERACCRFLTIIVAADETEVFVDITSDQPEAARVIELLVGADA